MRSCQGKTNTKQTHPAVFKTRNVVPSKTVWFIGYPWISPKLNVILRNISDSITTCNHQSTGLSTLLMAIIAGKKPEARWSTLIYITPAFNTYRKNPSVWTSNVLVGIFESITSTVEDPCQRWFDPNHG